MPNPFWTFFVSELGRGLWNNIFPPLLLYAVHLFLFLYSETNLVSSWSKTVLMVFSGWSSICVNMKDISLLSFLCRDAWKTWPFGWRCVLQLLLDGIIHYHQQTVLQFILDCPWKISECSGWGCSMTELNGFHASHKLFENVWFC